ncbi:MAG: PH domain-containing protein [Candidatus Dormibacterales bacterium]
MPSDARTTPPLEAGAWHRLHPLSPVVRAGRAMIAVAGVFALTLAPGGRESQGGLIGHVVFAAGLIVLGVVSWLVTRWRVEEGDLRIETGLIRRSSLRFPLKQTQAIDTVRPLLARVLGLSELRLRVGGSSGGSGRLAYLTAAQADLVRGQLLAIARGVPDDVPASSERVLVWVPAPRLMGSILLSGLSVTLALLVAALVATAVVDRHAAVAGISSGGALVASLGTILWRRLNAGYDMTVADAPDGLRVRSGLLQTTAETIPEGRVQAVRMVEPLLWRPLGWCRLEVDVAGRQRKGGEGSPEGRQLRTVLPVGSRAEATLLLSHIVPDAPAERIPPPARARFKSPLRYRNLSWGRDQTYAVTTSGRVARVTAWVPLTKVQSLRRVQGPLQRRLELATVYLDTAGRSVHAALRDRDAEESQRLLDELTVACRSARRLRAPA